MYNFIFGVTEGCTYVDCTTIYLELQKHVRMYIVQLYIWSYRNMYVCRLYNYIFGITETCTYVDCTTIYLELQKRVRMYIVQLIKNSLIANV